MRRHDDPKTASLRALPVFETARQSDLRTLAAAGDVVTVEAGRVLHEGGHLAQQVLLVLDGTVDVVAGGGRTTTVRPGQFAGVDAVLDGSWYASDAVAASEVTALAIWAPRLRALVETNPVVRTAVTRQLAPSA